MKVFVAVDGEAGSLRVRDGWFMAVGLAVLCALTGEVLHKWRIAIPPCRRHDRRYKHASLFLAPGIDPEMGAFIAPDVYENFWSKHLDVLRVLLSEMKGHTARAAWAAVAMQLQQILGMYEDVELVSDCPDFDLGMINNRLAVHVSWMHPCGVRYMSPYGRLRVRQPYEELLGFLPVIQTRLKQSANHLGCKVTHLPDDDDVHVGV